MGKKKKKKAKRSSILSLIQYFDDIITGREDVGFITRMDSQGNLNEVSVEICPMVIELC